MKALTILLSVLLALTAVAAQSLPLAIEQAEIDNTKIEPFGANVLELERDQEFKLQLEIFASAAAKDVEIRAFVSGYEYNDVNAISDRIGPFDFSEGIRYIKKMTLTLPEDVDLDEYYLRIILTDRTGDQLTYNYRLNVNTQRHIIKVQDIILSANTATAGQALLATVRLDNLGQKDEKDVKVVVSIPELNISATDYVEEIESNENEETEEMFLRLPKCAEPGMYQVNVEALYNKDHDKATKSTKITVLENEDCKPEEAPVVVVQQAENNTPPEATPAVTTSKIRSALEIILLVLVALLVIIGLLIGFTRMHE